MFGALLNFLFGCRHRRLSRPMTPMNDKRVPDGHPYVVCIECGTRFAYDAREMRLGKPIREPAEPRLNTRI
jgi:hypothetical protein